MAAKCSNDQKDLETDQRFDMECAVCYQTCVHPVKLPCGHIFCFLCAKGIYSRLRHCALCRHPIPHQFLDKPDILDKSELDMVHDEDKHIWFYQARSGGWWLYEKRCAQEIEDRYQKNKESKFELLIVGYLYIIDLKNMIQYRKDNTTIRRAIKRDLIKNSEVKGHAGLRVNDSLGVRSVDGCANDSIPHATAATIDTRQRTPGASRSTLETSQSTSSAGSNTSQSTNNTNLVSELLEELDLNSDGSLV